MHPTEYRPYIKMVIDSRTASLPVTDLQHVCREINMWRRTLIVMEHQRKYSRKKALEYMKKKAQGHGHDD